MTHFKFNILILLTLWPLQLMSQNHDFQITGFRESVTDLSAISSDVRDNNGKPTALIRFTVRDSQFEFDANLGIVKQERKTGEVWLYVPVGTKRITVSHPRLGVLRGYQLPISVKGKYTYDAEIVITNELYLQSLYGQQESTQQEIEIIEPIKVEPDIQESEMQPSPKIDNQQLSEVSEQPKHSDSRAHIYGGIGFNALTLMGPSLQIGMRYKALTLEGGVVVGTEKVKGITFTNKQNNASEKFDYSCTKAWLKLGVNLLDRKLRITPQIGATFNMIEGERSSDAYNIYSIDGVDKSHPMALSVALSFSYEIIKHFHIRLTPQYDFALGGDEIYDYLKQADSKFKSWGEGFGVNAALLFYF